MWRQRGKDQYGESLERYVVDDDLNLAMNELLDVILGISRAFETKDDLTAQTLADCAAELEEVAVRHGVYAPLE
jgi:hypothetical protein